MKKSIKTICSLFFGSHFRTTRVSQILSCNVRFWSSNTAMMNPISSDGIFQRLADVLLTNQILKKLRSPFTSKNLIGHDDSPENAAKQG